MADDGDKKDEDDKKDVAMKRPHNILNSAPDANPRTNTQIKTLVFWWSGLTLLYLWSGLKIDEESSFLGTQFKNFTEPKFLFGLLILNSVFWVRLLWRIYISDEYNKFYDDAVEDSNQAKNPKAGTVENYYEKNMRDFNRFEKQLLGLGIPILIGFVAIACLLCSLSMPWPIIILYFDIMALGFTIAILIPEIQKCFEAKKKKREALLSRIYFF